MKKDEPQLKIPSKETSYNQVLNLQDDIKVFLINEPDIVEGETTLTPPEPLENGIVFKISKQEENININFTQMNDRYYQKCDLLFETLFRLIEDSFDVQIENKDEILVSDHQEGGKNYCASNFFLERTAKTNVRIRNEKEIPNMKDIVFREKRIDTLQESSGLDLTLPIKNLKIYFEKTNRTDINGEEVSSGSPDRHMYFTMNFHLFFYNEYGSQAKKEEHKINQIVDEIEKVYCLNFGCEPDFKSKTELNFFKENTSMNPEHYMVVNYFKPSLMFEHFLLSQEDSYELKEEERLLKLVDKCRNKHILIL